MGRRVIAVLLAAFIALVGAVAVFLYARGADARAIAGADPRTVYVSEKPVAAGTSLANAVRDRALVKTQVAARALPAGALTEVTPENEGLVAITDIGVGEYVLSSRFGTTPSGRKAIQVPPGQVAVSVSLEDPARVGSFVTPGSRIVIYDTYEIPLPTSGPGATAAPQVERPRATRVLLSDVLVIAMGDTALTPGDGRTQPEQPAQGSQSRPTFLVTLALSPVDANRLVHGIRTGALYAGLRGADTTIDPGLQITDFNVFEVTQ